MWKRQSSFAMKETEDTKKKTRYQAHDNLIDKFLSHWYDIESQEENEEIWLNGSIISNILTTILIPWTEWMPEIKLENKEIFWKYINRTDTFEPYEEPMLKLKAYKKNTNLWPQFGQYEEMILS